MKLLELTGYTGDRLFLSPGRIVALCSGKEGKGTKIWVGPREEDYFLVRESLEQVVRMLEEGAV